MSKTAVDEARQSIPEANPDEPKTLDAAIVAVMEHCPYIRKTGKMAGGGPAYTFASEVDVLKALHGWLVRFGITFVPNEVRLLYHEQYPSARGNLMNRVGLIIRYRIAHAPSGGVIYCEAAGEGCDSGDKASVKAMTAALKYALRQTFNIETGDREADPDNTSSREQARGPQLSESAKKARAAMEGATSLDLLERYRRAANKRSYKPFELEAVNGAYLARKNVLEAEERIRRAASEAESMAGDAQW